MGYRKTHAVSGRFGFSRFAQYLDHCPGHHEHTDRFQQKRQIYTQNTAGQQRPHVVHQYVIAGKSACRQAGGQGLDALACQQQCQRADSQFTFTAGRHMPGHPGHHAKGQPVHCQRGKKRRQIAQGSSNGRCRVQGIHDFGASAMREMAHLKPDYINGIGCGKPLHGAGLRMTWRM